MHRNIYFFEKKKERGDRTELRKFYRDESEKQRSSTSHHGVPLSEMPRPWPTQQACPRGAPSTSASHARRRRRSTIPDLTPIATAATAAISLPPDLPPRRRAADTAEKMGGGGATGRPEEGSHQLPPPPPPPLAGSAPPASTVPVPLQIAAQ